MVYEVVCTKSYLDVGLLIEKYKSKPKRVLSRASTYSSNPEPEYGGVETLKWVNTGVFLSKDEWKKISYNKGTKQILNELGIIKNKDINMNKFTMELVWHSCNDYLPKEDYNPCLYVTDGTTILPMRWKRDPNWQRFESGGWYIEPNVNADGYWWADVGQTVKGEPRFKNYI